jgi:hypothetical protein
MIAAKDPQLSQVKLHPGVIVVGCLLLSVLAKYAWHLNLDSESLSALRYLGMAFVFVGIATLDWLMAQWLGPKQHSIHGCIRRGLSRPEFMRLQETQYI